MGLMDNLKDIASKAGEELKKAGEEAQRASAETRTATGGDIKARHEMNDADLQDAWTRAQAQMFEDLSPEIECHLQDLMLPKEQAIYKLRSSSQGDRSQLVLTNRCLYMFSKGIMGGQGQDSGGGLLGAAMSIGQISMRIYPIKDIMAFEFKPLKGVTVGHFQILTSATSENDNESKFLIDTKLGYFKSVLIYRKLLEVQSAIK
jgi:hypothetical protein